MMQKILIIRLGALGDIFLCMKPFQDIRATFPGAHITLMTTPPFVNLAKTMPWFDAVLPDVRPKFWQIGAWRELYKNIKQGGFTHVFDLQNKPRTALYFRLFPKNTFWSGTAKGCSHPRPPIVEKMHRQDEMLLQLKSAGVADSGALNLDWLAQDVAGLSLPEKYAVLVPGCSPHLLHKRWPPEHYAQLAAHFKAKGLAVMVVGTKADADSVAALKSHAPFIVDLCGQTTLHQLASLYRGAACVVGNDTGPTFLSAMVGAPTLTLMSHHTDPVLSGPRGPRCAWLKRETIDAISMQEVIDKIGKLGLT